MTYENYLGFSREVLLEKNAPNPARKAAYSLFRG